MDALRQIQVCKWTGAVLAVLFLSATFGRWNAFRPAPTPGHLRGILLALTLLLLLMPPWRWWSMRRKRRRGRLNRTRPFFERWSDRFS